MIPASTSAFEKTRANQAKRLKPLLDALSRRSFFQDRLPPADSHRDVWERFESIEPMTKSDLITPSGIAAVCDLPATRYVRWHQTSGTTGQPIVVRDTAEDWRWWMRCWDVILDAAEIGVGDVALMAFSFGPFIGFWSAADALVQRGVMMIPGGGLSSRRRAELIVSQKVSVIFTTPTYAMRLASVAAEHSIDLAAAAVRRVVVAGEPGGSIPAVRAAIETAYGASVIDHAGGSEVGPWGYATAGGDGLHVIESEYIAEVMDFTGQTPRPIPRDNPDRRTGELVLTPLGRIGCPVMRYRTGDIVCPGVAGVDDHLFFQGGVIGRADDMIVIRGVNVFPSSIDAIVRECSDREYRVTVSRRGELDRLSIELGDEPEVAGRLRDRLRDRLAMTVAVQSVDVDALPTFEAKARRWIDRRGETAG